MENVQQANANAKLSPQRVKAVSNCFRKVENPLKRCPSPFCGEVFQNDANLAEHYKQCHGQKRGGADKKRNVPEQEEDEGKNLGEFKKIKPQNVSPGGYKPKHERRFACDFCGKSFTTNQAKQHHHHLIHTGGVVKPHVCFVCDKRFSHKGNLGVHLRKHTGEKPYVCQYCTLSFCSKSDLTKHERIHSGDRPYRCDFCEKSFAQNVQCRHHMKRIHFYTGQDHHRHHDADSDMEET